MSLFAWNETYSIGVTEIDAQHRRLFSLANELHSAMNAGKGKAVLQKVLHDLITYTQTHFAAEERMMQKCGYRELQAHKAQHDELTREVLQLQRDFQSGKSMLTIEVMQFLSDWLRGHIGGTDRRYVPFVTGKA